MEKNKGHSDVDNPKWIEEDLFKLPCKELKKLARMSNVNPNFKKAELVKALLNSNVTVRMEQSEFKENERSTRRMTRSRLSMYQHPNEVQDFLTEVKLANTRTPSVMNVNETVDEGKKIVNRKGKQKRESVDLGSISDVFKMVSSIVTKSKPLKERTNNKTEVKISETNQSEGTEKAINKKSRRSETKENPGLKSANVDVKSCPENGINTQNESVPESVDNIKSNSSKNEKEDLCSQDNNNFLEVKDEKVKRRGRKKKLEEESYHSVNLTRVNNEFNLNVKSDPIEKPKVERKRRLQKKKSEEEEVFFNLTNNSKNNTDDEVKISDANRSIEPEFGNQKKRKGKTSKSETLEATDNKNISIVLTTPDISSPNTQINSRALGEFIVDLKIPQKRASRNSKVSIRKSKENNRDSVVDLFADSTVEANSAENLSNISGKNCSNETAMPVAVPRRSSTFILNSPDQENNSSGKKNQFDKPSRSNTFTIDEHDDKSPSPKMPKRTSLRFVAGLDDKSPSLKMPKRTSLRFVAGPASQQKSTPSVQPKKIEKSIGKRIFSAFVKKQNPESVVKSQKPISGSSVKKTITKSTTTPAYLNKFGVARKAPNFKNIHQKLFENMESLGENRKRQMQRAQDLLLSPAPRCAVTKYSPRNSLEQQNKSLTVQTPVPTLAPPTIAKTPGTAKAAPQLNRFGFKTRVNKVEANAIAGKKLPPIRMEKTKEKDRKFLQGVRTNKRFMLQMQMRQNQQ